MPATLSRSDYAAMFGPTTGDRLRLADTDLIIEVERDLTTYGEEVKFGASPRPHARRVPSIPSSPMR